MTNPNLWSAAVNAHGSFRVEFSNGGSGLEYQIYNAANVAMLAAPQAYTSNQAIPLQKTTAPAADFGAQIVVTGTPIAGDSFTVQPSTSQSLFKTVQNLIGAIQTLSMPLTLQPSYRTGSRLKSPILTVRWKIWGGFAPMSVRDKRT